MDTKDMEKEQNREAEATTPALDGYDAPSGVLVFDPERGVFYTVPEDQFDPTKYGIVTNHVEY